MHDSQFSARPLRRPMRVTSSPLVQNAADGRLALGRLQNHVSMRERFAYGIMMRNTRKSEIDEMPGSAPPGLHPNWIEGPFNADRLDVGVVTMSPGVATPPHVHIGGQVLVVTHGEG